MFFSNSRDPRQESPDAVLAKGRQSQAIPKYRTTAIALGKALVTIAGCGILA